MPNRIWPGSLAAPLLATLLLLAGLHAAAAASKIMVQKGDGDDHVLAVSDERAETDELAGKGALVTFICSPKAGEYGIVLLDPALAPAEPGADIVMKADGAALAPVHFEKVQESLMATPDGETGRALFGKILQAGFVELAVGGKDIRLALRDGKAEVDAYWVACQL